MATTRDPSTSRRKPKIRREDLPPGGVLCDHCYGKCCRYISVPLDEPTTWDDYDAFRWYLAHGQTLIYVEDGTWFLVVMARCNYLSAENRCGIYHDRPKVCREYTTKDCEYDEDWNFEKVFETPEQIWEYAEALLPARRKRKPEPPGPLVLIGGLSPRPVG